MKARRTFALSLLGVLVAGALGLGVAAPADAATAWPSGWNPKQFMINVLSSVLAGAGPSNPWKRAVIAADQKYDHSLEGLEEQWKLNIKTGGLQGEGVPGTYADYQLQASQYYFDNNLTSKQGDTSSGKKYVPNASFPATKFKQFAQTPINGAGAATGIIAAGFFGFQAGKGIASMMGLSESGLCQPSFADGGFIAFITGTDCSQVNAPGANFVPNADVASLAPGGDCATATPRIPSPTSGGVATTAVPNCRSLAEYVLPRNTSKWVKDGWFTVNGITQDTVNKKFVLSYKYSGPLRYTGGANWDISQRTQLLPYVQCVTDAGAYGVTVNFNGGFFVPDDPGQVSGTSWSNSGTYGAQQCNKFLLFGRGYTDPALPSPGGEGLIFRSGQPLPAIQDGNPDRTLQCTITGTDGNTYTASSAAYKDSDPKTAVPKCPALPDGVGPANTKIDKTGGPTPQTVYNEPSTPEYTTWWQTYPECREGACSLDLVRKDNGKSCFDSTAVADTCRDWMTDPDKATHYQCTYGAHDVSISECFAYGDVFKPEKVLGGQAYTDPATGESVPGQSSPSAAKDALGKPILDPQNFTGCLDQGWSAANPVEWVLVPVQCALQWAFAPRQAVVMTTVESVTQSWSNTPFAQVPVVLHNFGSIPVVTGCSGIPVDINEEWPVPWGIHWNFGAACDPPLRDTATTVSTLLSALLYAGAAVGFSWYVAGAAGYSGFGWRRQ